ncbi:MAG: hypothetical protein LBT43_13600 [Prevotella sp.]|nr:hypothetical protein [Prevotella sp.]
MSLLSKISLYLDFVGVIILTIIIFLIRYKSPKAISSFNSLGLIIGIENQSEILNLKIEEQQYHAINKKGIELRGSLSQEESDKIFDDYKKYIGKGSWDDFKLFIMGENHPNAINWNYHNNYNILQFKPYIFNLLNEIVKNGIGLQMGYSYKDIGSFICKHFIFEKKGSKMNDDKKKRIETIGKRYKEWLFSDE